MSDITVMSQIMSGALVGLAIGLPICAAGLLLLRWQLRRWEKEDDASHREYMQKLRAR